MATVTWISRSDVAGLACPYCGHEVDPDQEWVVNAQLAWGRIGVAVSEGDETVALLLLAPGESDRTAGLECLWVAPEQVGRGHGRRLVQASAAGMLARDVHAILARGARVRKSCAAPPVDFLREVGFVRQPDEPDDTRFAKLYRLDLDETVVDRPGLLEVLGRWVSWLHPVRPEPAGRVSRQGR